MTLLNKIIGKWQITHMDQWDVEPDYYIEFNNRGSGSFHFICVDADIDYRTKERPTEKVEFTFHGYDECDEVSGRGWVKINGSELEGYFVFHQGDESGFRAKLIKQKSKAARKVKNVV